MNNNFKDNYYNFFLKDSKKNNMDNESEYNTYKGYDNLNLIESNNFFNLNNSFESIKNSFYNDNEDDNSLKNLFNEIPESKNKMKNYQKNDLILKNNDFLKEKIEEREESFNKSINNKPKFINFLHKKANKNELNKHMNLISDKLNSYYTNEFDILNDEINSQVLKFNLMVLYTKNILFNTFSNFIFKNNCKNLKEKTYYLKDDYNKIILQKKNIKNNLLKLNIIEGLYKGNNYNLNLEINEIKLETNNNKIFEILEKFIIKRIVLNHKNNNVLDIDSDDYEKESINDFSLHGILYIFENFDQLKNDIIFLSKISNLISIIPIYIYDGNLDNNKISTIRNDFNKLAKDYKINFYNKTDYPLFYKKESDNSKLKDILLNILPLKLKKITNLLNLLFIENMLKMGTKKDSKKSLFYGILLGAIGIVGSLLLKKKIN